MAALIAAHEGGDQPAHLLGFIACFNGGRFFEAHDVLEDLWLRDRRGENGEFFKGLIQLAGAFVHVEKDRPAPAVALLKLARGRLAAFPDGHLRLDTRAALRLIDAWLTALTANPALDGRQGMPAPRLDCLSG